MDGQHPKQKINQKKMNPNYAKGGTEDGDKFSYGIEHVL